MEKILELLEEGTRRLGSGGRGMGGAGRSTTTSVTSSSEHDGFHNDKKYVLALFTMVGLLIVFFVYLVRYSYIVYKASQLAAMREAAKKEQNKYQRIVQLFETIKCTDSISDDNSAWNNQQGECEVQEPSSLYDIETNAFHSTNHTSFKQNKSIMTTGLDNNNDATGAVNDNLSALQKKSCVFDCCAICIETYQHGQIVVWSPNQECRHAYHRDCMVAYILAREMAGDRKILCPTCKNSFINLPGLGQTRQVKQTLSPVQKMNDTEGDFEEGSSNDQGETTA